MRKLTMVVMLFATAGLMLMAFRPSSSIPAARGLFHTISADTVPTETDATGTKVDTPQIQVDTGSTTPPGNG
jgi:hypothetical protein